MRMFLLAIICVAVAVLIGARFLSPEEADPARPNAVATTIPDEGGSRGPLDLRPIAVLSEGFAASSSCKECHPNEHQSWHASYHRTMTQVVDSETAPDAIRDKSVTMEGVRYEFEQDGDQFFVTFRDPLARGETRRRQIVLMTGSHHMHVFWYESDFKRTPGQLPIIFLKEQGWIPRQSAFLSPPDLPKTSELGRWNQTCSKCHSTHPRQRLNRETLDWDTHVVEFGIACEACHGPGAEHVKFHAANENNTNADASVDKIINPMTVSKQASADVCGRCHSIFYSDFMAMDEDEFFEHGSPFRPGQLLSESSFLHVIQAGPEDRKSEMFRRWSEGEDPHGSYWPDGMARVSGREYNGLIESACFQKGEMTCLSCHTMHPQEGQSLELWRDDQLKPGMRGDQACLQCHGEYADRISEHTHHAADSHGSRCMNCHMPHTTYGLLKSIRSHQISSPSVTTSLTTGRPSACTLCHLDQSITWTEKHLREWYDHPKIDLPKEADETSAAVLHYLKGDAGQRVLQAAAFGWPPAQEASGTKWMEPLLLVQMNDPYDAIRIISERSMTSLPGRSSFRLDVLAGYQQRSIAINDELAEMHQKQRIDPKSRVLINPEGVFDFSRAQQLIQQRDQRPIYLRE